MDKRIAIAGAAVFAVVGTVLLVKIAQPLYGASSLLACFACVGYLLLRRRATTQVDASRKPAWFDIGWTAVWGGAIATYALRPEPYERPLVFFILIALSCGVIAAKIIRCQLSSKDTVITLAQTIAIGLSLVWTVTLMYPSLIGLDPWTHRAIILDSISNGEWFVHSAGYQAWHTFVAVIMKTTGLEYRLATMFVSFLQVVGGTLLLFLLGRRTAGTRVGLLAALILSFSSWPIFFGYWTIPNGMGLILVLLIVYLVVKYHEKVSRWLIGAVTSAILLLLFTHTLAVVWLVALLCIWVVLALINSYHFTWKRVLLPASGIGASVIVLWLTSRLSLLFDLLFTYGLDPARIGSTQLPGLTESNTTVTNGAVAATGGGATTAFFVDTVAQPSWETAFNSLGMILGFTLAIAGCLWLLSKQHRSVSSWFVVLSFIFFLVLGIVPALLGVSVLEHRWWYAAQVFGAVPVAVAAIALHKVGKGLLAVVGISALSFLMMIGLPCNMDNYTFSGNQLARYALTQGELDAAEWALGEYDGNIGVDNYYTFANNLQPEQDRRLVGVNKEILSNNYSSLETDVVLVRDAVAYEPFALGEGCVYKLLYDPNVTLAESGYELVYSADGVNGYANG